jgi:large subunit ribosomal protein L3
MANAVILGRKLGMDSVFGEDGSYIPVTVIEAGPCKVVQVKTQEKDGYEALKLAFLPKKPTRTVKPQLGEFAKAGVEPHYHLREFRGVDVASFNPGDEILADRFREGDVVTVSGRSKGRGFAGTVRRHGFAGGPKTHGQSDRWRAPGSIGQSSYPSRVFKGMRMAGHMGTNRVTVKNLQVVKVITERNLVLVRGAVPGSTNGIVEVRVTRPAPEKAETGS